MLLILEIVLMIAAWKRGWKWWVLLPPVIQLSSILLVRLIIKAVGWLQPAVGVVGIIGDVLLVLTLIIMIIKRHRVIERP
jgi:hypothetical protein